MEKKSEQITEEKEISITSTEYNELVKSAQTWETKYKYLAADFENMKRRKSKEIADLKQFKHKDLIVKLLDVMDNCERSFEFDEKNSLIYKQLVSILSSEEVQVIPVEVGNPFDADAMNAISITNNEEIGNNCVSCVIKNGYTYKGETIRFADVMVNKIN